MNDDASLMSDKQGRLRQFLTNSWLFFPKRPKYCSRLWHLAHTCLAVSIVFLCRLYSFPHLHAHKRTAADW